MIALNTNELITLNIKTNNGSERIYKLRDYLSYFNSNKIIKLEEVKSFFSESLVLILFHVENEDKEDELKKLAILTYNIKEDKVL